MWSIALAVLQAALVFGVTPLSAGSPLSVAYVRLEPMDLAGAAFWALLWLLLFVLPAIAIVVLHAPRDRAASARWLNHGRALRNAAIASAAICLGSFPMHGAMTFAVDGGGAPVTTSWPAGNLAIIGGIVFAAAGLLLAVALGTSRRWRAVAAPQP